MNESDIDRLLRAQAPDVPVPPGLETRVRASLRAAPRKRLSPAWLAASAAALVILAVIAAPKRPAGPVVRQPDPVSSPSAEIPAGLPTNPLDHEARAIRNDAERTGRFLINCLPSLGMAEK
ncbi:MAG: hypothetical protein H7A49_16855 [Akkermansiaceae bacterium]|nr:hypothetical protein [Akkermansiaceae bacterium]MCP5545568.1 hypothetical protein [Akkermansiaceae bacterium]MCP5548022.1 hypothetical protein [Akkermansiaceae bacterium]